MERSECREFSSYATHPWSSKPDGFIVAQDGVIQFEYYDSEYGPDQPHTLWSVGKTLVGTLLGAAVKDGKLDLEQKLADFYPRPNAPLNYDRIKISNLFYSDTDIIWQESSLNISQNSLLAMLFGSGRDNMAEHVSQMPAGQNGPGQRWQYNTGTPVLAMGVLKKALGPNYETFPWQKLFHPLGMTSMVMEKDSSGTFVTSAYTFGTPRDMLKLGQLYLQRGVWNGQTLLDADWIDRTLTISPGFNAPGTTREQIGQGLNLVYGGLIWLNRHGRSDLPKPFPKSPGDMAMALGREGQFILMIPSKRMVLVRTGHGESIDDRIDGIVTRALACLDDRATVLADFPPAPLHKKSVSLSKSIKLLRQGMRMGMVQAALAKWVCSCHFVSKLSVSSCLKRGTIPYADKLARIKIEGDLVRVSPSLFSRVLTGGRSSSTAIYHRAHKNFGCSLVPVLN